MPKQRGNIQATISSPYLNEVRAAAKLSTEILHELVEFTQIGVSPAEIDEKAGELCRRHSVAPAFYDVDHGQGPFAHNLCISVNDAVLHGLPTSTTKLTSGDIIKLDFGIVTAAGIHTDQCVTLGLGEVAEQDKNLINTGKFAVQSALAKAIAGGTTGDIGHTIQTIVESAGYNVLKEYIGHGIGESLWEEPEIPAHGQPNSGAKLEVGMVLSIEAQIVAGSDEVFVDKDNWTVRTRDGANGVMFEYMVIVGEDKSEVITPSLDWNPFK